MSVTPEQLAKANTEHAHQAALFCQAARHTHLYPELEWMFAIPNGGERNVKVAVKLKAEGVRAGVSDIMLPAPRSNYHGFFIEMTAPGKIENTSDKQDKFGAFVTTQGYRFAVFDNWLDAWVEILEYLNGDAL